MITIKTLRELALSFPETIQQPHFKKISFRIAKKIFATCDEQNKTANLKLSAKDQDLFSLTDKENIYPVPNKWGRQGWTCINLTGVRKDLFADALKAAYLEVAPKKLGDQVRDKGRTPADS